MIPVAVPNIGSLEREFVDKALQSGYVGPDGPFVRRFEENVCQLSGGRWAIATCSGTAALELAVAAGWGALKINQRPCITVSAYAFPAMANVLKRLGYVTSAAAIGISHDVFTYTNPASPFTIADCAPAIGQPWASSNVNLCVYSFAANKVVTCGMGGALVGLNPHLERVFREAARQGHGQPGTRNIRMAELNAALGCAQLVRYPELHERKVGIWDYYRQNGIPLIDRGASRWMATAVLPEDSAPLLQAFEDRNIETRREPFRGLGLPCSTTLTRIEQDEVIATWFSAF